MEKYITAPISGDVADGLLAGDFVYISGTIYTARDAAHKRMYEALLEDKEIPFSITLGMQAVAQFGGTQKYYYKGE
ncbi:MAG: hypothetical protein HFH67_00790, partial [Lachnospiraceae bacterium]|nr:hypothetical protein [Lachnospiraceae bacterium]